MGMAGMVLSIIGLVLSFSLFIDPFFVFVGLAVACTATGLTLSGVYLCQALEEYGKSPGILIVGLGSGVVAFMVLIAWIAYAISTPWPT